MKENYVFIYRKLLSTILEENEETFDTWSKTDSPNYINYVFGNDELIEIIDNKNLLTFKIENNKLSSNNNYNFPIVICYIDIFEDNFSEDEIEEIEIEQFSIIKNEKELFENLNKDIRYIFEIKDDITEELIKKFNEEQETFEKHLMRLEHFSGDIIITDPCYIIPDNIKNEKEWNYYELENLGFTTYLTHSTLYGDWGCHTFNIDTNEVLGQFCADAGMVGVFLKNEVLKLYPNFEKDYKKHCYTEIKNYEGNIKFVIKNEDILIIRGKGNINFETRQTSL